MNKKTIDPYNKWSLSVLNQFIITFASFKVLSYVSVKFGEAVCEGLIMSGL
jgi:hypothetical protein